MPSKKSAPKAAAKSAATKAVVASSTAKPVAKASKPSKAASKADDVIEFAITVDDKKVVEALNKVSLSSFNVSNDGIFQ